MVFKVRAVLKFLATIFYSRISPLGMTGSLPLWARYYLSSEDYEGPPPGIGQLEETMKLAKPKDFLSRYFKVKRVNLGEDLPTGLIPPNGTPTVYFLGAEDEPLLEPIRRYLPDMGGLDFSAFVLLIGIRLVRGVLLSGTMAP